MGNRVNVGTVFTLDCVFDLISINKIKEIGSKMFTKKYHRWSLVIGIQIMVDRVHGDESGVEIV